MSKTKTSRYNVSEHLRTEEEMALFLEALNARELLDRLQEKIDIKVHLNTVKNALKRAE